MTRGRRPTRRRLLADPRATKVMVDHRDQQVRFSFEQVAAQAGRRPGETSDDLVGDMIEVLTGLCVRRYGRHGARNRALRALTFASKPPEHAGHADTAETTGGEDR